MRFTFYALVQAISGLLFLLMLRDLRRHHLMRADTPATLLTEETWRTAVLAAAFLISIPFSFVSKPVAYGCWVLIPFSRGLVHRVVVTTRERAERRSAHP